MNPFNLLKHDNIVWNTAIIGSAIAALLLNLAGLLTGIVVVLPHFLYIPVAIAAYRYPRRGALIAAAIGGIYLCMVVVFTAITLTSVTEVLVRTGVMVTIGWLIGTLTLHLRDREELYKGLFDHSEAGSILIRKTGEEWVIEEVNWKGAEIIKRKTEDLIGAPLSSFWGIDGQSDFFSRMTHAGAVYAVDATFLLQDGSPLNVLVSAASLPKERIILTFVDITSRISAERALKTATDKLKLLSRISIDHTHRSINTMIGEADDAEKRFTDAEMREFIEHVRTHSWDVARQLFLTESYNKLGTLPPVWMGVQNIFESVQIPSGENPVFVRYWTERLEIYADPLLQKVLTFIAEDSFYSGGDVRNVIVTYHEKSDGLDLIIENDGSGIPADEKQRIFEYDACGHGGIGFFISRQILGVTGITIAETGTEGKGARFVLHIPLKGYRIEGSDENAPAMALSPEIRKSGFHGVKYRSGAVVHELMTAEFPLAETLWVDYHQTKGDPRTDRIFAAFSYGQMVSVARCRRHPDGLEVDGVFTPVSLRGNGYSHDVVGSLVEACGRDSLFMYSIRNLTKFYSKFGFVPVGEKDLPPAIRARYVWAGGQLEGADVTPMMRYPTL